MNKQILLIDDDEDEREFFSLAITKVQGIGKCVYANSAEQGMRFINTILPDVIFLDINMPKINGFECLTAIRKMENFKKVPVILYSTGCNEIIRKQALTLGATDCISKSDSINHLAETLQKILIQN